MLRVHSADLCAFRFPREGISFCDPNARLERVAVSLQECDFGVTCKNGHHADADCLSLLPYGKTNNHEQNFDNCLVAVDQTIRYYGESAVTTQWPSP